MRERDWKRINEALVRRGELLLDLEFVRGWEDELEAMNKDKEGALFRYPDSFIRLLLFMYVYLHLPYRQPEGFTEALAKYVKGLKVRAAGRSRHLERLLKILRPFIALENGGLENG